MWSRRSAERARTRSERRSGLRVEGLEERLALSTLPTGFAETRVTTGLVRPAALEIAPDGRIFVAQQGGQLRVIKDNALLPTPFATLDVDSSGERGLLGVAFDPDFARNQFVYVYHTVPANGSTPAFNRVSRFTASGDVAAANSRATILNLDALSAATNHNGGAIHFGPDGKLYVATGENARAANAQSLNNRLGKILRINSDGSIPADNPFDAQATGDNRAIYALGLRNPYTFAFDSGSGRLFINDVGQDAFEEINIGVAGANYGWPGLEGESTDPRFASPVFAYGHGPGNELGFAISGGDFLAGPSGSLPEGYSGDYLFGDFINKWIRRYDSATDTAAPFATEISGFPVDLRVAPSGTVYYLVRADGTNPAALFRVDYTPPNNPTPPPGNPTTPPGNPNPPPGNPNPPPTTPVAGPEIRRQPGDVIALPGASATFSAEAVGTGTVTYRWQRNGQDIPGATGSSYTLGSVSEADSNALFRVVVSDSAGGTSVSRAATLTVIDGAIRRVYLDVLFREPDLAGGKTWTDALAAGTPRGQVVAAILGSTERRTIAIGSIYQRYLGRTVDPTGLATWLGVLGGGTEDDVVAGVVGSVEYAARNGGTTEGFARAFYRDILDRDPDPDGLASALGLLATVTRPDLARAFLLSDEALNQLATGWYRTYLRRDPDPDGLAVQVGLLRSGLRSEVVLASILASTEYVGRV